MYPFMIMLFYSWYQTVPSELIEIIETVVSSNLKSLNWRIVIISVVVYLLFVLLQHLLNLSLKKKDIKLERQKKINDICIAEEVSVFRRIDKLRYYQKGEEHDLLEEIESINTYLNANRILIKADLLKITEDIIDYFSKICGDFSKRDVKTETALFAKYKKKFYE